VAFDCVCIVCLTPLHIFLPALEPPAEILPPDPAAGCGHITLAAPPFFLLPPPLARLLEAFVIVSASVRFFSNPVFVIAAKDPVSPVVVGHATFVQSTGVG
jgi:hypothetical protein